MEPTDPQGRTLLRCPGCRKPTYTYIADGDVAVWCRHCKSSFEVVIKPSKRRSEAEGTDESPSD